MEKSFNVIAGLPRSGSTLLCNILNQRPDTFASSTSALPQMMQGYSGLISSAPEETARLVNVPGTEEHHVRLGRMILDSWHDTDAVHVFDKSRAWTAISVMLKKFVPNASIIVLVRDPREVLASIERQHRASGQYVTDGPQALFERCSDQVAETGIVGGPIAGIEDIIRRQIPGVTFIEYRSFMAFPEGALRSIEGRCGMSAFDYDFDDVKNTSYDLDPLYRNKFPHKGEGKVESRPSGWEDVISPDIAEATVERWPLFCSTFGYS